MWHCLLSGDFPCRQGTLYGDEQGQSGAQIWGWLSSVEHRVAGRAASFGCAPWATHPAGPAGRAGCCGTMKTVGLKRSKEQTRPGRGVLALMPHHLAVVFFKRLSRGCHAGSQHCLSPRWAAGADWDDAWLQHGFSWQTLLCARPCSPQPGHLPHLGLPPGHAVPVPFRVRG